jgi:hypothetical protein
MARFNENSTIKEILDDKEAYAILENHIPQLLKHPMVKVAYSYSISKALSYAPMIGIPPEKSATIKAELFALE